MRTQIGINTEGLKFVGSYIGACEQWEHVYSLGCAYYVDRIGMGGMLSPIEAETALNRINETSANMARRAELARGTQT